MQNCTAVKMYKGIKIWMDDATMVFYADLAGTNPEWPSSDEDEEKGHKVDSAKSYPELVLKIDAYLKAKSRFDSKLKANVLVVDEQGKRARITGVHTGHRTITTKPRLEGNDIYPVCKWIEHGIRELLEMDKRKEEIRAALALVEIDMRSQEKEQYSRRGSHDIDISACTTVLIDNVERCSKLAAKINAPKGEEIGAGRALQDAIELAKKEQEKRKREDQVRRSKW